MYLAETTVVQRREPLLHQADLDALLIFLNVREIAQAVTRRTSMPFSYSSTCAKSPRPAHSTTLAPVAMERRNASSTRSRSEALGEPNGQEGRKRRVAGAHRGTDLDLEGAVGKPDVLAVREVRARSAQGEQDILRPAGMQLGHGGGNGFLVAGMDVDAEDITQLISVGLDEQGLESEQVGELGAGDVEHELRPAG